MLVPHVQALLVAACFDGRHYEGVYWLYSTSVMYAIASTLGVLPYWAVQDRGLIPRVFQELFAQIEEKRMQQVSMSLSNPLDLHLLC